MNEIVDGPGCGLLEVYTMKKRWGLICERDADGKHIHRSMTATERSQEILYGLPPWRRWLQKLVWRAQGKEWK
jgi:hypothetical protein